MWTTEILLKKKKIGKQIQNSKAVPKKNQFTQFPITLRKINWIIFSKTKKKNQIYSYTGQSLVVNELFPAIFFDSESESGDSGNMDDENYGNSSDDEGDNELQFDFEEK